MFAWLTEKNSEASTWRGWGNQCRCSVGECKEVSMEDGMMATIDEEPDDGQDM
jgi:hypothetical protein